MKMYIIFRMFWWIKFWSKIKKRKKQKKHKNIKRNKKILRNFGAYISRTGANNETDTDTKNQIFCRTRKSDNLTGARPSNLAGREAWTLK